MLYQTTRLFMHVALLICSQAALAIDNMAYIEVNNHPLSTAGCFVNVKTNKPFFSKVGVFAANINGVDPDSAYIHFNPQVETLLNHTSQVVDLQSKGIKVLLTLLGNHENSGWACFNSDAGIHRFANKIVDTVNHYHLDGIDIDDEYSRCASNASSINRVVQAVKSNPNFAGKIISKALFHDHNDFQSNYNNKTLAEGLDYGWEMSYFYPDANSRLAPYLSYGMTAEQLYIGVDAKGSQSTARLLTQYIKDNQFAGVMVYDISSNSLPLINSIAAVETGEKYKLESGC